MAKEGKITPSGLITGVIAVGLVITAAAIGIRQLLREGALGSRPAVEQKEPAGAETTNRFDSGPRTGEQDAQSRMWVEEETQESPAEETPKPGEETELASEEAAELTEEPAPAAGPQQGGMTQGMAGWQGVWADLNLTPEEEARLREGWALAVARWQNMSPEERQIQGERMRASWQRFQSMSDEEKEEASREMRGRFEDWRRSGSAELPDMILD